MADSFPAKRQFVPAYPLRYSDEVIRTYDSAGTQNNLTGTVTVTADPAAFEKNVSAVSAQAIERLLVAVTAER